MVLKKFTKVEEHVLAFQFKEVHQREVREAIGFGIAEIMDGELGNETHCEHLFIKTAVDKKGRSRWTNIHNKECVVIFYQVTDTGEIVVDKAKKISKDSLLANYRPDLDDEPSLFGKEMSNVDMAQRVVDEVGPIDKIDIIENNEVVATVEKKSKKSKKA